MSLNSSTRKRSRGASWMQTVARKSPAQIMRCSSVVFLFKMEGRCVKVDIMISCTPRLWIPKILSGDTFLINDIPVMPLFDLLVMKIQGWRNHRASHRKDFHDKVDAPRSSSPGAAGGDLVWGEVSSSYSRIHGPCMQACPRFYRGMRRADRVSETGFSYVGCARLALLTLSRAHPPFTFVLDDLA